MFGIASLYAEGLEDGPLLGNPMQKHFDEPSIAKDNLSSQGAVRPKFADQSLPLSGTHDSGRSETIRQASTLGGGFGSPFPVVESNAPSSGTNPASNYFGPPEIARQFPAASGMGSAAGAPFFNGHPAIGPAQNPSFGMAMSGTNTPAANPYSNPNPFYANGYFNTESPAHASPAFMPQANLPAFPAPGGMPGTMWNSGPGTGMGGLGFFDPNSGQYHAAPNAMTPYAGYGPYGNAAYDPYGQFGSFQGNAGGMNWFGDPSWQQNPVLLQAMLQQEAIRHRVALEAEEEEEERKRREEGESEDASRWSVRQLMPVQVSSPLGNTLWSCVKTMSVFNTPDGPDRGVGMPLATRSWLDRPYYGGLFVGTVSGSTLVSDMIKQKDGGNGGLILGYNMNEYWGLESRLHFASIDIRETANGQTAYTSWYLANNPDSTYVPPLSSRSNRMTILDLAVHYYPLGNAKFRPFFKYGLGFVHESFVDTYGKSQKIDSVAMPIGFGLRYWWNERLAIQADIVDNVIFSEGIAKTQNNWAFTIGLTYSFGTSKKRRPVPYWPYSPSTGSKW